MVSFNAGVSKALLIELIAFALSLNKQSQESSIILQTLKLGLSRKGMEAVPCSLPMACHDAPEDSDTYFHASKKSLSALCLVHRLVLSQTIT
ncbi:hypothetical protein DUNSADRAFT_12476 [Dunaliella salina]|uniref:Encoded protein n=1 Tax=Dunaliella salina TaxID=3046 RepID=A0ABQ7H3W5_DUNSA|nr:hypothetical protein DUNSADRAFT_12476 [Dunaliella salina]|eukprot:KAF5841548.1 hypothetical protein DUNSADRAFT_12476 [Dunaliella salina]